MEKNDLLGIDSRIYMQIVVSATKPAAFIKFLELLKYILLALAAQPVSLFFQRLLHQAVKPENVLSLALCAHFSNICLSQQILDTK